MFGSSDAHSEAIERGRASQFDDAFEAVVAAGAPAAFAANVTHWKIELVVNDEDVFGGDVEECHAGLNAFTAEIHECLGLEKVDLFATEAHGAVYALKLRLSHGSGVGAAPRIERHEASVMSCICVLVARISEPNDEEGVITHILKT